MGFPLKRYVLAPNSEQKQRDIFFNFRDSLSKPLPCNCPICIDDKSRLLPLNGTKAKHDRAVHNYFQIKWATKKNKLTWKWPLINLEWLPDIIGNLDMLIEPSWIGLQREMLANVENKAFGKRIYDQLTTLLIETQIIKEDRRHIKCAIDPNRKSIVLHLQNIFEKSSEPWAQCFRYLWDNTIAISFSNLLGEISGQWGDISEYPIFKQWCEIFPISWDGYPGQ